MTVDRDAVGWPVSLFLRLLEQAEQDNGLAEAAVGRHDLGTVNFHRGRVSGLQEAASYLVQLAPDLQPYQTGTAPSF